MNAFATTTCIAPPCDRILKLWRQESNVPSSTIVTFGLVRLPACLGIDSIYLACMHGRGPNVLIDKPEGSERATYGQ